MHSKMQRSAKRQPEIQILQRSDPGRREHMAKEGLLPVGTHIDAIKAKMQRLQAEKKSAAGSGLPSDAIRQELANCQEDLRVLNLQRKIHNLEKLQRREALESRAQKIEELKKKLKPPASSSPLPPGKLGMAFQHCAKQMLEPQLYRMVLGAAQNSLAESAALRDTDWDIDA